MKVRPYLPPAQKLIWDPSAQDLKSMTGEMPNVRRTEFDNWNVQTHVDSRSAANTYVVSDTGEGLANPEQRISRAEAERLAGMQDEYIAEKEMLVIDGYIGNVPEFRTAARLIIELHNANIAGMQKILFYPAEDAGEDFEPEVTVIYTPNLAMMGYPKERVIAVDLDRNVTRVVNSDYFGESKKGGLRMWNKLVYDRGGLPLHAGCKVIPTENGDRVILTVGLSGTGKTTTTFTRQNNNDAGRQDIRHRGRLFRQDLRPRPEIRADHLPRRHASHRLSGKRVPGRSGEGRLLQPRVHTERPRRIRHQRSGVEQGRARHQES
jgi:phosphoenolpyruvate carboxykinase (ATP)